MSDNPYPNASDTMHYELHTAWDEGYAEGFAAGRAAATPDPRNGCRAPHCFSEYGTPCGSCPVAEKPETDT